MSTIFKKVRVIHSPEERTYYVEKKEFWKWERVDATYYNSSYCATSYEAEADRINAESKAIARAEMFLSRKVVWQKSGD